MFRGLDQLDQSVARSTHVLMRRTRSRASSLFIISINWLKETGAMLLLSMLSDYALSVTLFQTIWPSVAQACPRRKRFDAQYNNVCYEFAVHARSRRLVATSRHRCSGHCLKGATDATARWHWGAATRPQHFNVGRVLHMCRP